METQYKLGYALSGGGAKGFAHAGAIQALEEAGIFPEIVAGTSAGAIFGALYGTGYSPKEIFKLFKSKEMNHFAHWVIPKTSILDNSGLRSFFQENLGEGTFESLRFPLITVAANLDKGQIAYFSKGDLIEPVLASCCIPLIFGPIVIDGVHYVDGGLLCNFPVRPIRKLCDTVIGINVNPLLPAEYKKSIVHIAERTYHLMSLGNTLPERKRCDVLIEIDSIHDTGMFELKNIEPLFQAGYDTANKAIEKHWDLLKQYTDKERPRGERPTIVHLPDQQRFEMVVEGHTAYTEYRIEGALIDILHTIVPKEIGGRGFAAQLVEATYAYGRTLGLDSKATCSYAIAWLARQKK